MVIAKKNFDQRKTRNYVYRIREHGMYLEITNGLLRELRPPFHIIYRLT